MVDIRPLTKIAESDLARLTGPYICTDAYRVMYSDNEARTSFTLERFRSKRLLSGNIRTSMRCGLIPI